MRSKTRNAEIASLRHRKRGARVSEDHVRLAGKAHVIDVIRAISIKPEGLPYSLIHFSVVQTSATSGLLQEAQQAGLVTKDRGNYRITAQGRDFLQAVDSLTKMKNIEGAAVQVDYRRRRPETIANGPAGAR